MGRKTVPLAVNDREEEGCAFPLTLNRKDAELPGFCQAPAQPGSAYCPHHHALCHLRRGSRAEKARLREVDRLAHLVGGRRGRGEEGPSQRFLERLEQAVRNAL
jgi:hypothetical protein